MLPCYTKGEWHRRDSNPYRLAYEASMLTVTLQCSRLRGNRTPDTWLRRPLLYPLSYQPIHAGVLPLHQVHPHRGDYGFRTRSSCYVSHQGIEPRPPHPKCGVLPLHQCKIEGNSVPFTWIIHVRWWTLQDPIVRHRPGRSHVPCSTKPDE